MSHMCPVCGYPDMEDAPQDYEICDCCGTEFGDHDFDKPHKQLRQEWILNGAPWFSEYTSKPWEWNAFVQLGSAGLISWNLQTTAPPISTLTVGNQYLLAA